MTDSENTPVVDVAALAKLSRLDVTPEELAKLEQEIPEILAFVAEINAAPVSAQKVVRDVRNRMREDVDENESGACTEDLLSAAPERVGNHFKVPQVIKR